MPNYYWREDLLNGEHIECVVPKDASQKVFIILWVGAILQDMYEHQLKSIVPLFTKLFPLFWSKLWGYFILLNNMTKLICLEDPLIKGIKETKENIKFLCPIEHQGILILLGQVGNVVCCIFNNGQRLTLVSFLHWDMGLKCRVHPSEFTWSWKFGWGPEACLRRLFNFHFLLIIK